MRVASGELRKQWEKEDRSKIYAWPILISENAYQQVKDEFETEFANAVTVKGKTKPVNVYKIIGARAL